MTTVKGCLFITPILQMRKLTVIYYEILCAWLLSLSMMFSSLMHVVACPPLCRPLPAMATHTVGIYPPLGRLQSSGLRPATAYFLASPCSRWMSCYLSQRSTLSRPQACFCSFMPWLCPQAAAAETLPDPGGSSGGLSGVSVSSAAKQIGSNRPGPRLLLKPLSLGF